MGVFDKLKNALFEEEYVEIEEKPKKQKHKESPKKDKGRITRIKEEKRLTDVKVTNYDEEEPIAKKIVNEKKVEEKRQPERIVEDFSFPAVDDDFFDDVQKKQIKTENVVNNKIESRVEEPVYKEEPKYREESPKMEEPVLYKTTKEEEFVKKYTASEYGNYEKKKERKLFKPSPNISPVYGIIDDSMATFPEIPKKEIRLNSAVRSEKVDVDDIRRKAFGRREEKTVLEETSIDLTDTKTPKVDKITMGDAEEYFDDLGLEYNSDYIDAKREVVKEKRIEEEREEVYEVPNFGSRQSSINEDNDDNLFDLIDSMYDK